jgi:hypothetical protein
MGWWNWECKGIKIHKRVLHVIKGLNNRDSCWQIFKELKILTVTVLYICEMFCCIKKNIYLRRNLNMYEYDTRQRCNLHVLS